MNPIDVTKNIRRLEIVTKKKVTEIFTGNYKSSFKGQGMEVESVRRYEEGDDVRHIDWVTTAKQAVPFIKTISRNTRTCHHSHY